MTSEEIQNIILSGENENVEFKLTFNNNALVIKSDVGKDVGKKLTGKALNILEIIFQNPYITIPEIGEQIGLT